MILKPNDLEISLADEIIDRSLFIAGQNSTLILMTQVDYKNVLECSSLMNTVSTKVKDLKTNVVIYPSANTKESICNE